MSTLALTTDLVFSAKIKNMAESTGAEAVCVRSVEKLLEHAKSGNIFKVVLLDLDKVGDRIKELMPELRQALVGVKILGFFSHVNEETERVAVEAGVDEVIPRSKFVKILPELMALD